MCISLSCCSIFPFPIHCIQALVISVCSPCLPVSILFVTGALLLRTFFFAVSCLDQIPSLFQLFCFILPCLFHHALSLPTLLVLNGNILLCFVCFIVPCFPLSFFPSLSHVALFCSISFFSYLFNEHFLCDCVILCVCSCRYSLLSLSMPFPFMVTRLGLNL